MELKERNLHKAYTGQLKVVYQVYKAYVRSPLGNSPPVLALDSSGPMWANSVPDVALIPVLIPSPTPPWMAHRTTK